MKYIDEFFGKYFITCLILFIYLPYSVIIAVTESNYLYITLFIIVLLLLIFHYLIFTRDEDL